MKVQNPFPYTNDNKRYHTWSRHLKDEFGEKVLKVSLTLALIARTVMVRLLSVVVRFVALQDLVTLPATAMIQ